MNMQSNLALDHLTYDEPLDRIKYVRFTLANETSALYAAKFNEVLRYTEITPVPGAPHLILGIINLRCNVVTVIDARTVVGMPVAEQTHSSRIIVVNIEELVVGILVDRVAEVIDLSKNLIEVAPSIRQDPFTKFITGLFNADNRLLILVDFSRVVELLSH